MAEGLAGMHIGKMNLNERQPDCGKGSAQRNTGMGKRCRIDHIIPGAVCARPLDAVDEFGLAVGLQRLKSGACRGALFSCCLLYPSPSPRDS